MVIQQNIITGFIGTYTDKKSEGIYRFNFNTNTESTEKIFLTYSVENPTYLCLDRENNILYTSCKIDDKCGVASLKYYPEKDTLHLVNYNTSENKQPCHVSIDNNKEILMSSNYHENKMIVYETLSGIILNYPFIGSNSGKSINVERQREPHIHCSITNHNNKYILSCDLGIDKLTVYEYKNKKTERKENLDICFPAGSGPRQIVYNINKPYYYVLSELSSEIFVYKYKEEKNSILKHIQTISSTDENYNGEKLGAAIKVHPNGKFLYTTDRGNNTLNLFSINSSNGTLTYVKSYDTEGKCPRDFSIDPEGQYLICANKDSNNISLFSINSNDGDLKFIETAYVPSPSCIIFG